MNRLAFAALLAAFVATAASAQPVPLDPSQFDAYFSRPPKVEVNLRGAMLRLAASAVGEDDDEGTAQMLRGLRSILVRVYALDSARDGLTDQLATVERNMIADGWSTLVRVRPDGDDSDDVWVYVRDTGTVFDGMTVVSLDHDSGDASFVVIDGLLDPTRIGSLGGHFGIPDVATDADLSDDELERIEAEGERIGMEGAAAAAAEVRRADAEARRADIDARRADAAARRADADARREDARRAKPVRP